MMYEKNTISVKSTTWTWWILENEQEDDTENCDHVLSAKLALITFCQKQWKFFDNTLVKHLVQHVSGIQSQDGDSNPIWAKVGECNWEAKIDHQPWPSDGFWHHKAKLSWLMLLMWWTSWGWRANLRTGGGAWCAGTLGVALLDGDLCKWDSLLRQAQTD